jgi:hypothetical protein
MNNKIKIFLALLVFAFTNYTVAQKTAKPDAQKHDMKKMECCGGKGSSDKPMDCKPGTEAAAACKMNAGEADKNKDGKVYQCPMCPDQISDEAGKCAKCKMDLKEVAVADAQKAHDKNCNKMKESAKMESSKMMKHEMKLTDTTKKEVHDNIVRKGEIDLAAIDKNGDKKVFQDPMDWNVISDEAGECPLCGMNLKEVTLDKAKENLLKHNFKVKNSPAQK